MLFCNVVSAAEGIFNVDMNDNLSSYARYRRFGNVDEYRVGFQGTYGIKSNQSIYAGTHYIITRDEEWQRSTGYWLGYSYELNNGTTISAEFEQGIILGSKNQVSDIQLAVLMIQTKQLILRWLFQ